MERLTGLYSLLADKYGVWGMLLMLSVVSMFVVQLWYYLKYYARIPIYRNDDKPGTPNEVDGISVIVLLGDNNWYLDNTLPKLLAQDYPNFEIVIVEIGTSVEFTEDLNILKDRYRNIISTKMDVDPRFPISNKMAYNIGIKASSYDHIILTTDDAYPLSAKWLSCMAKGFIKGDVLIGYCGIEPKEGLANGIMRCDRLMTCVRYLSAAIAGKPYRGIIHNMGFSKKLYFMYKGFDHLNMNLGEDDLFVQRIVNSENASIVMNPHASMREGQWGGMDWWIQRRKFEKAAVPYYPVSAKTVTEWELGSRVMFLLGVICCIVILPLEIKLAALALLILRSVVVRRQMWKIRRRLGEKGLGWILLLHDIISPFIEVWLYIMSRLKPAPGIWR